MHYDSPKWKNLISKRSRSENIKSLREEIAILREVLNRILDQCDPDSNDILLMSGPIGDTITKIERLVISCHKLEVSLKFLLEPQSLDEFTSSVITILTKHLRPETLAKVAEEILECKSSM